MPDSSTILSLPYILPAQAQKHVTHNEAVRQLDVIVQLAVTARNLAMPPMTPVQGDRYIVAAGGLGAWAGKSGQIALFDTGVWQFFTPLAGWTAWIAAESALANFNGTIWVTQADLPQRFSQMGVSATADATNRLTVSSPATLLNHAGAGHQMKLNKAAITDTASLLFQTGFSSRAEMGTAGNDDFSIKVSADGSAFVTGLSIAGANGQVTLPAAVRLGGQAADPVTPTNGMIWLNSTTGEVKVRSNGASIVMGSVTGVANSQLATMAAATFKGRDAGTAGTPQDLTPAQVATVLPLMTSTARGLAPPSGGGTVNFLRADGTWAAPPSGGGLPALGITATAAQINASVVQNRTNLIINGTGRINQRGYVSGTATTAANQFTLDRWFVVTSGQALTFAGTVAGYVITAPAGGVAQVIEGANITGGTHCLSWVGNATATVNGAAVANGGTMTLTAGANATLRFAGGTVTQAQLELGTVPTPYQRLDISDELRMCQRYFENGRAEMLTQQLANTAYGYRHGFAVRKRANPTISVAFPFVINSNNLVTQNPSAIGFQARATCVAAGFTEFGFDFLADAELTA